MSELINVFEKLSEFYPLGIVWEQVEDIYAKVEQDKANKKSAKNDDDGDQQPCTSMQARQRQSRSPSSENNEPSTSLLTCLPVVQQAWSDSSMLAALLEVSTTIRAIRESGASYDNTFDCWDQVIKVSPRDGYLAFIYICVGLGNYDPKCRSYRKLSLAAASTYFLSLTIPGAKGFHIFQEEIISTALQVFTMIQNIENPEIARSLSHQHSAEMWVNFTSFCDDLKLLFRYVGFEEYKGSRDAIVERLIDMQFLSYDKGFPNAYAANLHGKYFEIFDEVLSAHNGDPKETLLKILNMTLFLHTYPPKPKGNFPTCTQTDACEHISDWYIKMIDKFPRLVSETLEFYIKVIITNPERGWRSEHTQRAIEYAAKYDAALFTRCNASIVDFLSEAVYADEISIRSRSVDLLSKMILLESNVDWQMFRHEVSEIPREVYIIKELIDSIRDVNNNIKLKAVQAIQQALVRGSPNARKILTEGLKFAHFNDTGVELPKEPRIDKNEIRFSKPNSIEPQYTFSGVEIVLLSFLHMPEQIYALFCNPVYLLRRAAVMLTEAIVKVNPLIIFNTNFVQAACSLVDESTALVRKQTLIMVDSILATYPNCYPVVYVWCKIITPMFQDSDPKNIDLAMECFRTRVLLNIKGIDQSNEAEHFMPWVIIRTLLITTSRLYLQVCFHTSLKKHMIDQQIISTVESHIFAANSTEAWVLLNFICGKIKSKEPDSLIHCFVSYHSSAQWNNEQNLLIALEVLNTCISDFSHSALNYVFNHLLNFIQSGLIIPQVIDRAFDFLTTIENRSMEKQAKASPSHTSQTSDISPQDWLLNLHIELEDKLLEEMSNFPDNRSTYMSYLFSYSEANLHIKIRPHRKIILFIHTYMLECIKIDESELELDNDRIFNSMIVIAGRFSIREPLIAATTCNLYGSVLEAIDRPQIVNTILVAISDLCKKHTQLIEMILDQILRKLSSQYLSNRRETFNNFTELVLQDQLKLKGSLLLALLGVILDEDEGLSRSAINFFDEFVKKKNPALFLKCLIECPFVLNGYSNFEGLDSFTENMIKSPLKGNDKRRARQKLYNHFMGNIDDINLILYFGNLKTIAEKTQTDPMINSPEGCDLIKDTLYILKSICQKERKDTQKDEEQNGNSADDTLNISEIQKNTDEQMEVDPPANVPDKPQGRKGKRRDMPTMPEALAALEKSIVFIVTIAKNTASFDISIQKSIDELAKALSIGFPSIIEFAQPVEFWSKYRKGKVTSTPKRKQSRISEKDNEEDEGISEDEKMDIDSEHGEECVTPSKRQRSSSDVLDQMMLS